MTGFYQAGSICAPGGSISMQRNYFSMLEFVVYYRRFRRGSIFCPGRATSVPERVIYPR